MKETQIEDKSFANRNQSFPEKKVKILRAWKIDPDLAVSFKHYCTWEYKNASCVLELAISEYMVAHPHAQVNPSYTIVVQANEGHKEPEPTESLCTVALCKNKAVAEGVYLPKDETYFLCEDHYSEFRGLPKLWKVSR